MLAMNATIEQRAGLIHFCARASTPFAAFQRSAPWQEGHRLVRHKYAVLRGQRRQAGDDLFGRMAIAWSFTEKEA